MKKMRFIGYNGKLIVPDTLEFYAQGNIGCVDIPLVDISEEEAQKAYEKAVELEPIYKVYRDAEMQYMKNRNQEPTEENWNKCRELKKIMAVEFARITIQLNRYKKFDLGDFSAYLALEDLRGVPYTEEIGKLAKELMNIEKGCC